MTLSSAREEIARAIASQNPQLEISEKEAKGKVTPLFMTGPREGELVNWVIEIEPNLFAAFKRTKRLYSI